MKTGLATSAALHAAALLVGMLSLSAPRPFEVPDVEALPVDIVPVESITKVTEGDKKAALAETPAPKPTEKPPVVPDATKTGDNKVDIDKPPTPEPTPRPVERTAAAAPAPEPMPKPLDKPEPQPARPPEPAPPAVPATELKPTPEPKAEVKPDPTPEPKVAEALDAEAVKLPDTAPSPAARPQPPQAQTAKTPDRRNVETPAQTASTSRSESDDFDMDKIAALLNKEKPSGGGARRSTRAASLGSDRPNNGAKLSQSEMDALRGQVEKCWNIPAGAQDGGSLKVSVQFKLDRNGALEGQPRIVDGGGSSGVQRAAAEAARRAVSRCSPYTLPADKYEAWADVIVHFDPSDMF